jgi:hypothetical protein
VKILVMEDGALRALSLEELAALLAKVPITIQQPSKKGRKK